MNYSYHSCLKLIHLTTFNMLVHLFVREVKVAEFLPQRPVLAEAVQSGRGLSQVDDVIGIGQLADDLVLHVQRQVVE